jgi:hypothetical protein
VKKVKMKKVLIITITLAVLAALLNAQTYSHKRVVVSTGGGIASADGQTNRAVIGQTAVGIVADGIYAHSAGFFFKFEGTVGIDEENILPAEYTLDQNFPNPFNPATTINYSLPEATHAKIEVYNILGQKVAILVDEFKEAGYHSYVWRADRMPSGIYFYRITADEFAKTRKMLIIK